MIVVSGCIHELVWGFNLRVDFPRGSVADGLKTVVAGLAVSGGDHAVVDAMAHEEGDVLVVAVLGELGKLGGAQEPGGQGEDAAELVLRGKAGQDRQSTTLGETTEQDALSGDTGVDLGLDEALEVFLAALDALGVLVVDEAVGRAIEELDVEPSLEFTAVVLKSAMLARREKTRECVGYRLTAEMGR